MRAALIYNPNAGGAKGVDVTALCDALSEAGFRYSFAATETEADLERALGIPADLVVVAGGDGALRAAAKRRVRKPVALAPTGTANNLARALGVPDDPLEALRGLARPRRVRFDVGRVEAPWGEALFLEGAGYGLYADALATYRPEDGKSVLRAATAMLETLPGYEPETVEVRVDGEDASGSFLVMEALNAPAIGPRLNLVPDADTSDGLLDVLTVAPRDGANLLGYLRCMATGTLPSLPGVTRRRAREVVFRWTGRAFHVDGEPWPVAEEGAGGARVGERVRIRVDAGALELWLPAAAGRSE